jgi:hypothetical protein
MQERNEGEQQEKPERYQENPTNWEGGEKFQVALYEQVKDGKPELTLQIFDGEEFVIVQFSNSVRNARTLFLGADTPPPPQPETQPLAPPIAIPETKVAAPPAQETEKKPVKLAGKITKVGQLQETKKKKQPMLLFKLHDEKNNIERRAIAFDSIAQRLAAPETELKSDEPITIFAWKHENTMHINGQKTTIEDWYVQKAVYHGTVFEKPRATKRSRTDTRQ